MARLVDLTGQRFTRWFVEGMDPETAAIGKPKYWLCVCDCGTRKSVFGGDLKRGGSLSCGCLAHEQRIARSTLHNMSHHPAYRSWIEAKVRCENAGKEGYSEYGGRGIRMFPRWSADFLQFWEEMGSSWREGLSLDRIDVNGDYAPGNCRWSTAREQGNNRRNNVVLNTPAGKMTVAEAARAFGLEYHTLLGRFHAGWPESDLFRPSHYHRRKVK